MRPHSTRTWSWALLLPLALAFAGVDDAEAKRRKKKKNRFVEASSIAGTFHSTGAGAESGRIAAWLSSARSSVQLSFDDLVPGQTYAVTFAGAELARITGDADEEAELAFEAPLGSGHARPLDFDPRLGVLALKRGGQVVLRFDAAGMGSIRESLRMSRMPGAPTSASGSLVYVASETGSALSVGVAGLAAGDYEVEIDGARQGTMTVTKARSKKKKKKKRKKRNATYGALRIDDGAITLGERVDVKAGGQTLLSTELLARAAGVSPCEEREELVFLGRVSGVGRAKARYRTHKDCDEDFQVEVEDVAPGSYGLRVGGVPRGTIVAAFDPTKGQVEGEIEFDTDADDADELPLTFDPRNVPIDVVEGATLLFSGSFGSGAGGGGGAAGGGSSPGVCEELEVRRSLQNLGLASRASGDARRRVRDDCRRDFRVEVEDLPVGAYDLFVDGVRRGGFAVAAPTYESELEFDTDLDDPGELPLDFDPAGSSIEVRQGGRVYLRVVLP